MAGYVPGFRHVQLERGVLHAEQRGAGDGSMDQVIAEEEKAAPAGMEAFLEG